jgi:hypothetical protein
MRATEALTICLGFVLESTDIITPFLLDSFESIQHCLWRLVFLKTKPGILLKSNANLLTSLLPLVHNPLAIPYRVSNDPWQQFLNSNKCLVENATTATFAVHESIVLTAAGRLPFFTIAVAAY